MYSDADWQRRVAVRARKGLTRERTPVEDMWRTEVRRDYARVMHSAAFRRLQGKTQLFPGIESDFFRNRLTHSLAVAEIGEQIAHRLNHSSEYLSSGNWKIHPQVVNVAGLAHDLARIMHHGTLGGLNWIAALARNLVPFSLTDALGFAARGAV